MNQKSVASSEHMQSLKLAERLNILTSHGTGLLTRVNYLLTITRKESLHEMANLLSTGSPLANVVRGLQKNKIKETDLQNIFAPGSSATLTKDVNLIKQYRKDVVHILEPAYTTIAEIYDFRNHFNDLIAQMDAFIIDLKIDRNFDTTYLFLELVVTYTRILLLLRRIADRRIIVTMYHYAAKFIETQAGDPSQNRDQNYRHVQELLHTYENPIRQLIVDFNSCGSRQLESALKSVSTSGMFRQKCEETNTDWQLCNKLTIINPSIHSDDDQVNTADLTNFDKPWRFVGEQKVVQWVYFGYLLRLNPASVNLSTSPQHQPDTLEYMFRHIMKHNLIIPLFRSETLQLHKCLTAIYTNLKQSLGNVSKKIDECTEWKEHALREAPMFHVRRRAYLRESLHEQVLMTKEVPGLLAPKLGLLMETLTMARDEVLWCCYHRENAAQLIKGGVKGAKHVRLDTIFRDDKLGELIFYMEELSSDIQAYHQVVEKYYMEFLAEYDAPELQSLITRIQLGGFDLETHIFTNIIEHCQTIKDAPPAKLPSILKGIRLDWQRLQLWMMRNGYLLELQQQPELTKTMHRLVFHTRVLDDIERFLVQVGDLSDLCFHKMFFEESFARTREAHEQMPYALAWPMVCTHLVNSVNDMCPEEFNQLRDISVKSVDESLKSIAGRAHKNAHDICLHQGRLGQQCLGSQAAKHLANNPAAKDRKRRKKEDQQETPQKLPLPGHESVRKDRTQGISLLDQAHAQLVALCSALSARSQIIAFDHVFSPKMFFVQQLEIWLGEEIVKLMRPVKGNDDSGIQSIRRPSEVLFFIRQYMSSVEQISNYIDFDVMRLFNAVLLQQTQMEDNQRNKTVTYYFIQWYCNTLLKHAIPGKAQCIVYSEMKRCFVTIGRAEDTFGKNILDDEALQASQQIDAEMYTNRAEMRAFCELLGAYGLRLLCESLSDQVLRQINEIKRLVQANQETLEKLRKSFKNPAEMNILTKRLTGVDDLLSRFTLIGVIYQFRELVLESAGDVLEGRIPYVLDSITDFVDHLDKTATHNNLLALLSVTELAMASGVTQQQVRTNSSTHASGLDEVFGLDPVLVKTLKLKQMKDQQQPGGAIDQEADYRVSTLILVFIAIALPELAKSETKHDVSIFHPQYLAHINNGHCISQAINHVLPALFYCNDIGMGSNSGFDTLERIRNHYAEFLALTSLSLLQLGQSDDKVQTRNRESVYLILERIVNGSPYLGGGEFELCFPYVLLRNAFQSVRKVNPNSTGR